MYKDLNIAPHVSASIFTYSHINKKKRYDFRVRIDHKEYSILQLIPDSNTEEVPECICKRSSRESIAGRYFSVYYTHFYNVAHTPAPCLRAITLSAWSWATSLWLYFTLFLYFALAELRCGFLFFASICGLVNPPCWPRREVDWPPVSVRSRNSAVWLLRFSHQFLRATADSIEKRVVRCIAFFIALSADFMWLVERKTQTFANFCVCAVLYRDHWTQGPMVTSFMVTLAMNKTNTHCCLYI